MTKRAKRTQKQTSNTKNTLIQVGLAICFTVYFFAHHFLGVYSVRWILYIGFIALIIVARKDKTKKREKIRGGILF
jgi:hypothetical protein